MMEKHLSNSWVDFLAVGLTSCEELLQDRQGGQAGTCRWQPVATGPPTMALKQQQAWQMPP